MARKALVKAGYLTGAEAKEELTREALKELAAGFVADILHLAQSEEGGKNAFDRDYIEDITQGARNAFSNDGGAWKF